MATNPVYMLNKRGGIDMLACRHASTLPPEHQPWGGLVHEATPTPEEMLRIVNGYGMTAVDLVMLEDGGIATILEDTRSIDHLHQRFSYLLRVPPYVGADLLGRDLEQCMPGNYSDTPTAEDMRFGSTNWALCVVKPDAKQLSMESLIRSEIESRGLSIKQSLTDVALTLCHLDQLWPAPYGKDNKPCAPSPWWASTIDYMTAGPVDVMLVHGNDASIRMKELKSDLRAELYGHDYQLDSSLPYSERVKSVIHTSDCNRELAINTAAFWTSEQIDRMTRGD